jgi:hypothetical protein
MRKFVYSLAVFAALAATLTLTTLVASRPSVVRPTVGQGTQSPSSVSKDTPLDLMIKHGKSLPAEQWDAF